MQTELSSTHLEREAESVIEAYFLAPKQRQAPWPHLHAMRAISPTLYSNTRKIWMLTGFAEVETVLRSPDALLRFADRMDQVQPDWRSHPATANLEPFIAFVDGAPHRKIRRALSPAWTPQEMERYRPRIRQAAQSIVADYVARGGGSFPNLVAFPLAEQSLYKLFSFTDAPLENARGLVERMQLSFELDVTQAQLRDADAAACIHHDFWHGLVAERAKDPSGDDMISELLRDGSFTVNEVGEIAESLFSGGFDSTALTATTGLWLLTQQPEIIAEVRRDPSLIPALVNELIRLGGAILMTIRIADKAMQVGSARVAAGQVMGVGLAAANRDPAIFHDPDRIDLHRPKHLYLSFSYGVHACIGQWMARVELQELLAALMEHTTEWEFDGEPCFRDRQSVHGIEELKLRVR